MPSYKIPEANPGQDDGREPPELEALTKSIDEVLDFVAREVRLSPGLKVYAADDKKWLRVGFRLEYPNGVMDYVCARAKDAFGQHSILRYEAFRSMMALLLERGKNPQEAIEALSSGYEASEKLFRSDHLSIQEATKQLVRDNRAKQGRP